MRRALVVGDATSWFVHAHHPDMRRMPRPAPGRVVSDRTCAAGPSGVLQPRIAPGLAVLTDDVLFGDVWTRPELSPRHRSLVTVSVLIATGRTAQLAGHLNRALANGVRPSEASDLLAHLAIYCGWPNAVSALDIYDQVYTARKIDTTTLRAVEPRLPQTPHVPGASTRSLERSRRSSRNSPTTSCSAMCGDGLTSARAIAAW